MASQQDPNTNGQAVERHLAPSSAAGRGTCSQAQIRAGADSGSGGGVKLDELWWLLDPQSPEDLRLIRGSHGPLGDPLSCGTRV